PGNYDHRERIQAAAAVIGREDQPEVAQLGQLLHDLPGNLRRLVVQLVGDRKHLAVGEVAHALADLDVLLGQRAAVGIGNRHRLPASVRRALLDQDLALVHADLLAALVPAGGAHVADAAV